MFCQNIESPFFWNMALMEILCFAKIYNLYFSGIWLWLILPFSQLVFFTFLVLSILLFSLSYYVIPGPLWK